MKTPVVVVLLFGLLLVLIISFRRPAAKWLHHRDTVIGANYARMTRLCGELDKIASFEPESFSNAVSNGIATDATMLPAGIKTNFSFDLNSAESNYCFHDSWGSPLNVVISRKAERSARGRTQYRLLVWSNGPNGRNQMGKGDDVTIGETVIEEGQR